MFFCQYTYAQNDVKSVLDKVASVNNGYKTILADFKFKTSSQGKEEYIKSGKFLIKGNKYKLVMDDMEVLFDGKDNYTYIPKNKEVNITKPEPSKIDKGDFFFSNPRDVFKGYNKNFKSAFSKESSKDNNNQYLIDLFPTDLKTKYTRVRMSVQKQTYHINNMTLFLKDGTLYNLEFSNFKPNAEIQDKEFVFDLKKYPGAEVNDMRF